MLHVKPLMPSMLAKQEGHRNTTLAMLRKAAFAPDRQLLLKKLCAAPPLLVSALLLPDAQAFSSPPLPSHITSTNDGAAAAPFICSTMALSPEKGKAHQSCLLHKATISAAGMEFLCSGCW